MKQVFRRPYVCGVIAIFILYIILAMLISGFYNTIPLILRYANTVNWWKISFSLLLSLAIGVLVAVNAVVLYLLYKRRKQCATETTLTSVGTIGGLATGICPLCVTGLFPLVFGLFGVSFSFSALPLQGIEVQIVVIGILLFNLHLFRKPLRTNATSENKWLK